MKTVKLVKSFTIDRSIWLRGEGSLRSGLHRKEDGKQCCVGIWCSASGISKRKLSGLAGLTNLQERDVQPVGPEGPFEDIDIRKLYSTNDLRARVKGGREHELKRLFGNIGVTVIFKGR